MKHLFVPYELALLAREKGFNESCFMFYYNDGDGLTDDGIFKTGTDSNPCDAPLYQQLVDWFRVKHGLGINIMENEKEWIDFVRKEKKHECRQYNGWITNHPVRVAENDYYEALKKGIEEAFKLI
jgi:hypothetical protein